MRNTKQHEVPKATRGIQRTSNKATEENRLKPTLNDMRRKHGLEPLPDGEVVLTKV